MPRFGVRFNTELGLILFMYSGLLCQNRSASIEAKTSAFSVKDAQVDTTSTTNAADHAKKAVVSFKRTSPANGSKVNNVKVIEMLEIYAEMHESGIIEEQIDELVWQDRNMLWMSPNLVI